MGKDKPTSSNHGAAEVSGGLREAMESRQFNSLAEVQAFTVRYTQQRNQRPLVHFAGFFGLAAVEPVSEKLLCREYRVKGLPLLHNAVQFHISR